jgi:hypothetical protein
MIQERGYHPDWGMGPAKSSWMGRSLNQATQQSYWASSSTKRCNVQQVIKRATKINVALGGLRHLRPEHMRQLYQACATPLIEYGQATSSPGGRQVRCGAKETVVHVLMYCPRLKDLRNILRRKIRCAFNNISDMLEGEYKVRKVG